MCACVVELHVQGLNVIQDRLVCLTISSLYEYFALLCFYVRAQVAKHSAADLSNLSHPRLSNIKRFMKTL